MRNIKINRKRFIMVTISFVLLVLIVIITLVLVNKGNSQEKIFKSKMEELGKNCYETFYYQQIGTTDEEKTTFLKKYESTGIKINLDNLSRCNIKASDKILEEFVNNKTKKQCDKNNSQVIIYPKAPYTQTSYEMDIKLDCGFKEE